MMGPAAANFIHPGPDFGPILQLPATADPA